ncbi:uncharacterized protein ACJ7VT_013332 [Polymixia lowei]
MHVCHELTATIKYCFTYYCWLANMEHNFADLLSDAFSETSLPSFPDEELTFESKHFDETVEAAKTSSSYENLQVSTEEDEFVHTEATGHCKPLTSSLETYDIKVAENDDEEDTGTTKDEEDSTSTRVSVINMDNTTEEQYESSDEDPEWEDSGSEEDEDEEEEEEDEDTGKEQQPGAWSVAVHCGEEFWDDNKEDRNLAEGQPLAPEVSESPQVRNEEQGETESESESDEDVSYFREVPKRGSRMVTQGDWIEEQKKREERLEDSTDSECEGMKIVKDEGKEVNLLTQCFPQEDEGQCDDGDVNTTFDFPQQTMQYLQDLISDDDTKEDVLEKMKDFSGDDHQEAGESFADYPSDFSSCEYTGDKGKNDESKYKLNVLPHKPEENSCLKSGLTEIATVGSAVEMDEKEDQDLDTGWTGTDVDVRIMGLGLATGETDHIEKQEISKHASGNAAVKRWGGEHIGDPTCLDAEDTFTEELEGPNGAGKATISLSDEAVPNFSQHQYNIEAHTNTRRQSESDTYSSSDDEVQVKNSDWKYTDNMCHQYPENNKPAGNAQPHSESTAGFFRGTIFEDLAATNDCNKVKPPAFSTSLDIDASTTGALLFEDLTLNTEDTDKEEILPSEVPTDVHTTLYSPSQGSVDDDFFYTSDPADSRITDLGQFGDDEYEEQRNWDQEQERIKAFYKFYDDSEGDSGKEGRKTKVQFCADPLSQVIHYDTESSDRDSLDSSTDGEEDLSSAETDQELRESEKLRMNSALHSHHTLLSENAADLNSTQVHTRKHKCLDVLKLLLKMGVVILMGLLMFGWATDQLDWLGQVDFFWD